MAFLVLLCVFLGGFHEAASRIAHRGVHPLVPYGYRNGVAFMPADIDIKVAFGGQPPVRYVTDKAGARIGDRPAAPLAPGHGVLVVGDSQALGYMMPFENTFGAKLAKRLEGAPAHARLLAAPATDLEAYPRALDIYHRAVPQKWRLAVLTVNLGNDLDEMAVRPEERESFTAGPIDAWLLRHSFAYMDFVVFKENRVRGEDDAIGLNPILIWFNSGARVELTIEAANRVEQALSRIESTDKVVVIVPSDYQVDPRELRKYGRYYADKALFRRIANDAPVYAAMMNPLDRYLAERLRQRGVMVVQFTDVARQYRGNQPLFDGASHHLTPVAHGLIAAAVSEALAGRPPSESGV